MKKNLLFIQLILLLPFFGHSQSLFKVETDFFCQGCGPYSVNLDTLKKYSPAEVSAIFNEIANSGITFTYPQGGCQQRAEIMHLLLKNKFHISHAKIWLFAPKDLIEGNSTLLEIPDPNHFIKGDTIRWGYHVAPCIIEKLPVGKLDTIVIDPSLDRTHPLTIYQWFAKMKNARVSKYTFLDPQWYFFNTMNNGQSNVLNGYFYNYGSIPGNTKTTFDQLVLERELAINDVAIFLKGKLDRGATDTKGYFKDMLSNVESMINFNSPQERIAPSFWPVTYRQILYENPELAAESMKFYYERLIYWATISKQMNI